MDKILLPFQLGGAVIAAILIMSLLLCVWNSVEDYIADKLYPCRSAGWIAPLVATIVTILFASTLASLVIGIFSV